MALSIRIKLFDVDLPLPAYQTAGAAGFDLYARRRVTIGPGRTAKVPLNVALELPPGYWLLLAARSSLHTKGLMLANGVGVGDEDFRGDNDEYLAVLTNLFDRPATVGRGERIVQGIILPRQRAKLERVEQLGLTDRGGLGSTGRRA
ncbi:MAG: dUTP diphosphatase [Candidatus Pacebacteria bacterium CG10_big_fil_rev_8_21_14_0_10_56_10]|nr:MAG: dUTP diphosphatase [Candidatus Pacebacteria bacterium CG10_big_fil_rev_8_21_14_0_10_56_10]